jgi:hypothetical protein
MNGYQICIILNHSHRLYSTVHVYKRTVTVMTVVAVTLRGARLNYIPLIERLFVQKSFSFIVHGDVYL